MATELLNEVDFSGLLLGIDSAIATIRPIGGDLYGEETGDRSVEALWLVSSCLSRMARQNARHENFFF